MKKNAKKKLKDLKSLKIDDNKQKCLKGGYCCYRPGDYGG